MIKESKYTQHLLLPFGFVVGLIVGGTVFGFVVGCIVDGTDGDFVTVSTGDVLFLGVFSVFGEVFGAVVFGFVVGGAASVFEVEDGEDGGFVVAFVLVFVPSVVIGAPVDLGTVLEVVAALEVDAAVDLSVVLGRSVTPSVEVAFT